MQNSLNIQVCKFYQYLHVQCGYMSPYYNAHIQHCDLNQLFITWKLHQISEIGHVTYRIHLLIFTFAPFKNDSTNKNLALLKNQNINNLSEK